MVSPARFKGKVVFVSGGSKGIGFASAERFFREGATVCIGSRSAQNVSRAVKKLKKAGGRAYGEEGDFSKESEVVRVFNRVTARFGRIDILINAAGISVPAKIEDITVAEWNYILNNNLSNTFLACKHVLKHMKRKRYGKIVNVSSIAGRFRSKLAGIHYTCAKAAVIALTKQLAAEVGKFNINVNVVCPSQTRTQMLKPFLSKEVEHALVKSIPLGYLASPAQQADVILFLASDQASYMTGAVVDVNGGQL